MFLFTKYPSKKKKKYYNDELESSSIIAVTISFMAAVCKSDDFRTKETSFNKE